MIALRTTFVSPGNSRGARIKCDDGDGRSVTVTFDHGLSQQQRHGEAVVAFIEKYKLRVPFDFIGGDYGDGMVWVALDPNAGRVGA